MNKYSTSIISRREAILRLVHEQSIGSQEEILRLVNQRGFRATQPTLSRDLRALGIARTPSGYVAADTLLVNSSPGASFASSKAREERLNQTLREFVASVEPAGSLVVLRTPSAGAQPVARALDEAALPEVAGTIAGDDTVFVATRSTTAARKIIRRFSEVLKPPRSKRRS